MDSLSRAHLTSVNARLGRDFILDYERNVKMRSARGGTCKSSVMK